MSILQIVDLKKDYGEEPNITHALKGIQFEVDKGEFVGIQQLTDTIEQKKRFQIISKLGVNKSDCGRYIRQQMIFKFGLPVMVSLIFSIGTLAFLTLTGYEEYIVYISLNEMLAIFAVVYAAFIGILISYFVSTYYLFKKHMALS